MADTASAQGITVSPVVVQMAPGQMAAALTAGNQGDQEIAFQIRAFAWQQSATGDDQLSPTDELLASPPLATVAPGASQVVRLVLRHPPQGREATYRILFDQLSAPSEAGRVHIALRLSIPVFAEPTGKVAPHVQWRITAQGGQAWLIGANDGTRHQTVHDIALHTADGRAIQAEIKVPPHILAGGLRRWRILTHGPLLAPGAVVRLTANADSGPVEQQVQVDAGP
jgi:fimbrial chaperone protein